MNVAQANEEKPQITEKEESTEVGECLLLKRALLKVEKETGEPAHRKSYSELHENPKVNFVK